MRTRLLLLVAGLMMLTSVTAYADDYPDLTILLKQKVYNDDGSVYYQTFSGTDLTEFFSLRNCECAAPFDLQVQFASPPTEGLTRNVEVWVGSDCGTVDETRPMRCVHVTNQDFEADALVNNQVRNVDIPANLYMFPATDGVCSENVGSNTVYFLISESGDAMYEHQWSYPGTSDAVLAFDTQPPPVVADPASNGVEDGVLVSWTVPIDVSDIRSYQILCAHPDGTPFFDSPPNQPEYRRAQAICTNPTGATGEIDAGVPAVADAGSIFDIDAGPQPDAGLRFGPDASIPLGLDAWNAQDPRYVCSGPAAAAAGSIRVDLSSLNLPAGTQVMTQIVISDVPRNYTAVPSGTATPAPVRDGYEYYKDEGGKADGGFCFVATAAYGDYDHPYVKILRRFRDQTLAKLSLGRDFIGWYYRHSPPWAAWLRRHPVMRVAAAVALLPVVLAAGAWEASGPIDKLAVVVLFAFLTIRRRQRRRRGLPPSRIRRKIAASVIGVAILILGTARFAGAQTLLDDEKANVPDDSDNVLPLSNWVFEIKFGPYYPDIDGESGLTGQPYHETFGGGDSLLPQLELDRFFFHWHGELGVGASLGYITNSANSWEQDPVTGLSNGMRSLDTTTFHMIPLAIMAVYRFTDLADRTVVPLVPYVKLGLSYYTWWITKGNGDVSSVPPNAEGKGGTIGWQGTVGLAFRADRLDAAAARSIENELGIEHMSFFLEGTYGDVSGLWESDKLHLGDLTWAAGLNFEF